MNAEIEVIEKWFSVGLEAGEYDSRIDIENSLRDTLESCQERRCTWITDPTALIWADIAEWETTAHFYVLYGAKIIRDAGEDYGLYCEIKAEFWRGFLMGRNASGVDIYAIAQELMAGYEKERRKWAKE